jgi:hypothetical protein
VAVVSLSRIQLRRGKSNGQPLPQLASGELAWAIDTQELYIGNGSTAEGAPQVGNTRILTEADNIFENYQYKNLPESKERSLQDRLDDNVSLRAFDGINDTVRLKQAIDALFGSGRFLTNSVILYIEPGTYNITETITLPPNTRIQGSGIGRTFFKVLDNTSSPVFSIPTVVNNTEGVVVPSNLYIDGLSIDLSDVVVASGSKTVFSTNALQSSQLSNIEFVGSVVNRDSLVAVELLNYNIGPTEFFSRHNIFEKIYIKDFKYSFYSSDDISHNTIRNCFFENNLISVFVENTQYTQDLGCIQNLVESCWFEDIEQNAIKLVRGSANVSKGNKFNNVGNSPNGTPLYPVIDFGLEFGSAGNLSEHDWFERVNEVTSILPYIPTIVGNSIYDNKFKFHKPFRKNIGINFVKFNLYVNQMQTIEVTYQYKNTGAENIFRSGTLTILANAETGSIVFDDDFTLSGNVSFIDNIEISVLGYNLSGSIENSIDTLEVTVLDSTNSNDADFYYSVKYIN